jgi:hypothetical protein
MKRNLIRIDHMVIEILSAAVANTTASTAATQNGLDIGDYGSTKVINNFYLV